MKEPMHFLPNSTFYFFPNRRTLKFLKVKCNPTNKKLVALWTLMDMLRINNFRFRKRCHPDATGMNVATQMDGGWILCTSTLSYYKPLATNLLHFIGL